MDPLATPAEIAEYLQVKEQTLRLWAMKDKGPPFVMVEGRRRYEWSAIRAYVEERTVRHG